MNDRAGNLYRWVGDKSGSVWGEMEHALLIGRLVPVDPDYQAAAKALWPYFPKEKRPLLQERLAKKGVDAALGRG